MSIRTFRKLPRSKVNVFKIKNRRGYAAVCLNNLTEGRSPSEAVGRLTHPLKRMGYQLN